MTARRRYIASSMFSLLLLATARLAVSSRDIFPICTSMCEDPAASQPHSEIDPCIITPTCGDTRPVAIARAPGRPVNVTVESKAKVGPDDRVYLSIDSQWYAPEDRISKLTGFEVVVMCPDSECVSRKTCFTISFNRSLTAADAGRTFSVSCLFGNFSIPEMDYTVITRSLPLNDNDSNRDVSEITLPSCREQERVALCLVSKTWELTRPRLSRREPRTVVVSTSPATQDRSYLAVLYEVYLLNAHTYEPCGPVKYTNNSHTWAEFYDVPDGTYFAWVKVSDCEDCTLFRSSNEIQIPAPEPTLLVPTTKLLATTYISQTSRTNSNQTVSAASGFVFILSVVGGCLGGILLVLVVSVLARYSVMKGRSRAPAIDPSTKSSIHSNNGRYELAGDTDGNTFIKSDDYRYIDCEAEDNPSMIPHTPLEDWKQTNGHLLRESNRYAEMVGKGMGDSISTTALDIQSTVTVPSSVQMDSGYRTYSDIVEEDGERVLSLALTDVGERV